MRDGLDVRVARGHEVTLSLLFEVREVYFLDVFVVLCCVHAVLVLLVLAVQELDEAFAVQPLDVFLFFVQWLVLPSDPGRVNSKWIVTTQLFKGVLSVQSSIVVLVDLVRVRGMAAIVFFRNFEPFTIVGCLLQSLGGCSVPITECSHLQVLVRSVHSLSLQSPAYSRFVSGWAPAHARQSQIGGCPCPEVASGVSYLCSWAFLVGRLERVSEFDGWRRPNEIWTVVLVPFVVGLAVIDHDHLALALELLVVSG